MSSLATSIELPAHPEPSPFAVDEHGRAQVGGTRVTLEVLLGRHRMGDTRADLHRGFPTVPLPALDAVIAYYGRNTGVLDRWLDMKAEEVEEVLRELDRRQGTAWKEQVVQRQAEANARLPR